LSEKHALMLAGVSAICFGSALVTAKFGLRTVDARSGAAISIPTATALLVLAAPFALDVSGFTLAAALIFAAVGIFFPAVVTLLTFAANDRLGQPEVHRTTLMKQAFLAETIRPLYRQWRRTFAFVRYRYGPYSEEVFQRLDTLIFNGLAEVATFDLLRGRIEARYRITSGGRFILKQVDANEIAELATDLVWALQTLGIDQAGTISKLVY